MVHGWEEEEGPEPLESLEQGLGNISVAVFGPVWGWVNRLEQD